MYVEVNFSLPLMSLLLSVIASCAKALLTTVQQTLTFPMFILWPV